MCSLVASKSKIVRDLRKQCRCFYDAGSGEHWKCVSCEAREYIEALTNKMHGIGCEYCNKELKEMLE